MPCPKPEPSPVPSPNQNPSPDPTPTPCPNLEPSRSKVLFVVAKIRSLLEASNLTSEHLEQVFKEMDVSGEPQP